MGDFNQDEEYSRDDAAQPLLASGSDSSRDTVPFPSCRWILAIMAFLGFVNVYCLRVNLSVAMVSMVNSSYQDLGLNSSDECPGQNNSNPVTNKTTGEFNWDSNLQGLVLGAFFYGYVTTQLPGGWLAERIGGKLLFGLGVFCTAALTLLTPIAARTNVYLFIALRVLEGVGEGVTFPAVNAILAQWAPPLERSKLGTFIYAGSQLGTVISSPVSGLLCEYGFAGGWPSVFYVFGIVGCIWFFFWMYLCYDSPAKHPRITEQERVFIEKAIGSTARYKKRYPTPWGKIFTSTHVWATIVAHFCNNWGYYTLLTTLPTYMRQVLKFDISQNGVLSGMPYFFMWLIMVSGGQLADFLRSRNILSTTSVRKLFNTLGLGFPAIFLVIAGYLGCNTNAAVATVTLAVGLAGLAMSGYGVNHLDLAPPFAGTLMGITNGAASIPGFVGPQVVGALTHNDPSRAQWRKVFFISSGVYAFGFLTFLFFGTGEQQYWSTHEYFEENGLLPHEEIGPEGAEDGDNNENSVLVFGQQNRPTIQT